MVGSTELRKLVWLLSSHFTVCSVLRPWRICTESLVHFIVCFYFFCFCKVQSGQSQTGRSLPLVTSTVLKLPVFLFCQCFHQRSQCSGRNATCGTGKPERGRQPGSGNSATVSGASENWKWRGAGVWPSAFLSAHFPFYCCDKHKDHKRLGEELTDFTISFSPS